MVLAILRDPLQYMAPSPMNKLLASWFYPSPEASGWNFCPFCCASRFGEYQAAKCAVLRSWDTSAAKNALIREGNEDSHGDALKPMRFMAEDPNNKEM